MDYFTQRPGETAREYAQRYLLYQIINLNFEPGQKISDMEISKELNISRTPVREAFPYQWTADRKLSPARDFCVPDQFGDRGTGVHHAQDDRGAFGRDELRPYLPKQPGQSL